MNDLVPQGKGTAGFLKWLTTDRSDLNNEIRRNVQPFEPNYIDRFFPEEFGCLNAIVTGENRRLRNYAIKAQAGCANKNGQPIVILHEGNFELASLIRTAFSNNPSFIEISSDAPCFDPFWALTTNEIAREIYESAPASYDIKFNIRYYLEGLKALLKKKKRNLTFNSLLSCPHFRIFDLVSDYNLAGILTDTEADDIRSRLMMGQAESLKLEAYLNDLNDQIEPSKFERKRFAHPENIVSGIMDNKVLLVDITSVGNSLWMDLIVNQMNVALKKGKNFHLAVDSITVEATKKWKEFLKNRSDRITKTIAAEDIIAFVKGDEKDLNSLIADTQTFIVLRHSAGQSAAVLSKLFGEYEKYEASYTSQKGSSRRTPFSLFSSPNQSSSVTYTKNRESAIKSEQIMNAGRDTAFIKTPMVNAIVQIRLLD